MKLNIKNTLLIALTLFGLSCQNDLEEVSRSVDSNKIIVIGEMGCKININGPTSIDCGTATSETYTITGLGDFTNPQISWAAFGSGIAIPSGVTSSTIQANFSSNFDTGYLKATVTDGKLSCISQITIDCAGDDDPIGCGTVERNYSIYENIKPCYPSAHPHGRYTLYGASSANSISWTVRNGIIHSTAGGYIVMEPTSVGGFTLTATINYPGGCTETYSQNFYAESCN